MSQKTDTIGGKVVLLQEPYSPDRALLGELVGQQGAQQIITAAWMGGRGAMPLAPLLLGEPGVGKNRIVYELARRMGKDLYIFQGHEDVTAEDLACAVRFSDDPGKKMEYVVSPLVTAMHLGGICFIDEIAKIRPRALALLVSVLDERRYVDSTLLAARVHAHPGFRFIAATNTADLEGNALPEFIRSRMRPVISMGYPPRAEIDQIVRTRFPRLEPDEGELLDRFWVLWATRNAPAAPTPRDAIYVFNLAVSLADFDAVSERHSLEESSQRRAFPVDDGSRATSIDVRHIELAFQELYPKRDGSP